MFSVKKKITSEQAIISFVTLRVRYIKVARHIVDLVGQAGASMKYLSV